jgi:hypothetical protein
MRRSPFVFRMACVSAAILSVSSRAGAADRPFEIQVVDDQTGRGVPLVELRTVHGVRYFTDSNGLAAFDEPGLMREKVFFHVQSHGYEYPKDGFGFRGTSLVVAPGGHATLKIHRLNIAQRLYRVTGAGIYRDSLLVGRQPPTRQPLLCGKVLGSDSVCNAVYRGKIYWFWGDTNWPAYPLGNFQAPGATSELPASGGLDPRRGVDLSYILDEQGRARPTAPMSGDGPTWLSGLAALPDDAGKERLVASYVKIRPPMNTYRRGLMEFDDAAGQFKPVADVPLDAPLFPNGNALRHRAGGVEYVYFAEPYPLVRVRATRRAWQDLPQYEAFTCLRAGSREDDPQLDRAADGALHYAWRRNTPPLGPKQQAKLVEQGRLKPEEAWLQLCDRESGKPIQVNQGSVYWNAWRQRFVMVVTQLMGTSLLGEVWYAEADTPAGPWVYAVKIVTHNDYSFYNPKQHPMFDADGGRTIFFEGTYTQTFSGNKDPTPRYDYNQIMYQLDLGDPRLALPVPMYQLSAGVPCEFGDRRHVRSPAEAAPAAFFAMDRPGPQTVPVHLVRAKDGPVHLRLENPAGDSSPTAFYALKADTASPPATARPLYEFLASDGRHAYSTDARWTAPGFTLGPKPLCLVWNNPLKITSPCDQ